MSSSNPETSARRELARSKARNDPKWARMALELAVIAYQNARYKVVRQRRARLIIEILAHLEGEDIRDA